MRVAFVHAGVGDTGEFGLVELIDSGGTTVTHAGAQATDHLIDDLLNGALVRHTASDALGHQFLHLLRVTLEVTVLRTVFLFHGFERAHTTVALELTAVVDNRVARTLLGTGYQ